MKEHVRSVPGGRTAVTRMADAVPDWLAEVMRPKKVPVPWGAMAQAVIAIWVPLAIGIASGNRSLALLPAMDAPGDAPDGHLERQPPDD